MKLKRVLILSLLAGVLPSGMAWSHDRGGHGHGHHHGHHHNDRPVVIRENHYYYQEAPRREVSYEWAEVTDVIPIMGRSAPRERCWTESVRYEEQDRGYDSATGTIVGGIVGGALGNALGHKKINKQVGTAVGVVLGASVGHDLSSGRSSGTRYGYSDQTRCENYTGYDDVSYGQEVVGYRVYYRQDGYIHETRMDSHPGDRIRIPFR